MLTRYSEATAAAATGSGVMSFALLSFFFGISQYTNTFIAQYYGAKNKEMCARSMWQGVYFAVIAGAIFPFTLGLLGKWLIVRINHEPHILTAELTYFTLLAQGAIFPLLSNVFASFYSGRGDTKTIMWVNICIASLNVFLNYLLIFGKPEWHIPELGIAGAALATITSACVGATVFILLVFQKKWRKEYGIATYWKFRWPTFYRLIKYGGPSGLSFGLDISAFALFVLLIGRIGKVQLIASNIVITIHSLAFIPMLGFSIATTILVGKHIGEERSDIAEKSAYKGTKLAAFYMVIMGVIFILFPYAFFALFKGEGIDAQMFEDVYRYGKPLLYMMVALGIFDAANVTFSAALKGAGDTMFTMWTNVVLAWIIFIPPVYLFTSVFNQTVYHAWACFLLYVFLLATVYCLRFRSGKWKGIQIRETTVPSQVAEITAEARPVEN